MIEDNYDGIISEQTYLCWYETRLRILKCGGAHVYQNNSNYVVMNPLKNYLTLIQYYDIDYYNIIIRR